MIGQTTHNIDQNNPRYIKNPKSKELSGPLISLQALWLKRLSPFSQALGRFACMCKNPTGHIYGPTWVLPDKYMYKYKLRQTVA